ncbi:MAG TPA: T9SS type A sorting domain-containing protein [Flavipsychrobacter sp.]|nr:T9SS type A sorting domain-containing protein [Flavipsychrobacter sp.]
MKKAFIIYLFVCLGLISYGQTSWQWGKRGGSGGGGSGTLADERVIDMATDRNGNVYALAVNNPGLANVDGHPGRTVRDRLTIASWSCNGSFRWMKNYGGASITMGRALAVDSLDGVYVTGQTISNNSLGYTYLDADTNLGNTDKRLFIVKYDTSGNLKWLKMPQPDTVAFTSLSRPLDMVAAPNGDLYWYCFLTPGNYDANAFTVNTPGYYITRFSATGAHQGTFKLDMVTTGGGNSANLDGITIAENSHFSRDHVNGRFYLTGQFDPTYGTLAFGSTAISSTGTVGALPIYLTAFNSSGNFLWTKQSANNLYANTRNCRPVIDPQGNIYVGGDIYSGNTFAGHTFTNSLSVHSFPFILSVDMSGTKRWASSGLPRDGAAAGYNIAYTQNTVGMAGYYGGLLKWDNDSIVAPLSMSGTAYILLTRHDANTGLLIGMDSIASQATLNNVATSITGDKSGNFFVGGSFDYRLFPGKDTIASVGGTYDWFVAKFGSQQCNCSLPLANFTNVSGGSNLIHFTYTGTMPYISVSWNFGDGTPVSTILNPSHTYSTPGTYSVCVTVTTACGTNTYCKPVTTSTVGINAINAPNPLRIYPNPVTDHLTIDFTAPDTKIEIYNATGICVYQTRSQSKNEQLDVSSLSAGLYFIRLSKLHGEQQVAQFIKQ